MSKGTQETIYAVAQPRGQSVNPRDNSRSCPTRRPTCPLKRWLKELPNQEANCSTEETNHVVAQQRGQQVHSRDSSSSFPTKRPTGPLKRKLKTLPNQVVSKPTFKMPAGHSSSHQTQKLNKEHAIDRSKSSNIFENGRQPQVQQNRRSG